MCEADHSAPTTAKIKTTWLYKLDIIHHFVFYSKNNVLENGFYLQLQVEPTQVGAIDRATLGLWTPEVKVEVNVKVILDQWSCPAIRPPARTHNQFFSSMEIVFGHLQFFLWPVSHRTRNNIVLSQV
jgi:hypothetical protein